MDERGKDVQHWSQKAKRSWRKKGIGGRGVRTGDVWMNTEIMCWREWSTSDCWKARIDHANGPFAATKRTWKHVAFVGKTVQYRTERAFAQ